MSPAVSTPVAYQAAQSGVAWFDASAREHVRVTGPDRASFLQGMVSNDVEALPEGGSCEATLLTVKGSMVSDLRVTRLPDALVLELPPGRGEAVLAFLNKYLISEEAEVVAAPELATLAFLGAGAQAAATSVAGVLARWQSPLAVEVLLPREALAQATAALAAMPRLDAATYAVLRVEAGLAEWGAELTEATIPLEANLERALNYKKGCYIGQEVIARATYRGQMNKKLMAVLLGDATPEPKTELRVGEKKVGWVTTVVQSVKHRQHLALAYVHRDHLAPGTTLDVASGGKAIVTAL